MSFDLPIADPNDEQALLAARKRLDIIKSKWKADIRRVVFLETVQFLIRLIQFISIARFLADMVLKKNAPGNYLPIVFLIFLAVVNLGIGYILDQVSARFSAGISEFTRVSILEQLESGLVAHKFSQGIGGVILSFGKQAEALAPYFTRYLPQQTLSLIFPLVTLAYVFSISWVCGLIMFLTIPIVPVYMILIGKGTAVASRNEWKNLTEMGAYFYDRLKGITTLYIFGSEQAEEKKITQASIKYEQSAMKVLKLAFLSAAAVDFFSTIIIAGVAIVIGLSLIGYVSFGADNRFNLTNGLILLMVVPEFFAALKKLGLCYHDRARALGAMMVFQRRGMFCDDNDDRQGHVNAEMEIIPSLDLAEPVIAVKQMCFNYPDGEPIFTDFNLTVNFGEKLWVSGSNGSGKSTLLDLLHGFRLPVTGTVTIAGLDTLQTDPQQFAPVMGWAGQGSRIFKGTLRDNLSMGRYLPDVEIKKVLGLYLDWTSFIAPYDEGLDTMIEEDGKSISGGERHKVSLARVLLKEAPILLLDEPFTHLDQKSSARLMHALAADTYHKTIILVTHKGEQPIAGNFKLLQINEHL